MTARLDSTILTLRETHQVTVAENRSRCLGLMRSYRKLINSIPQQSINYDTIDFLSFRLKLLCNEIQKLAFDIKELDRSPKTPLNSPTCLTNPLKSREYSVLDRLNLDPPLLRSRILRTTKEDYLELIEPTTSLECDAQNIALKKLASKVVLSLSYITTPIGCLQNSQLQPWLSKQTITIPQDTRKHMQYLICGGQTKLEKLDKNLQGSLSVVFKTSVNSDNLALKSAKKEDLIINECVLLMVLDSLKNPHIIKAVAISNQGVFLPYADGSLLTLSETNAINDPQTIKRLFLGIAKGLLTLHQKGLTHKDVKLQNILIKNEEAVLCDLGLTFLSENDQDAKGTPLYAAPECFVRNGVLTNKIDSWSFGICLLTIINSGYIILQDKKALGLSLLDSKRRTNFNPQLESLKEKPIMKERDPQGSFLEIVKSCLQKHLEDRPPMEAIIEKLESMYL